MATGHKAMFDEMDRVLLLDSPGAQLLSYNTTFQLGDFYVSVLSFKHVLVSTFSYKQKHLAIVKSKYLGSYIDPETTANTNQEK